MAKKAKSEATEQTQLNEVVVSTLNIKSGDWVQTGKGWSEAITDAYRDENGLICVEIMHYGIWKYSSSPQNQLIKRPK